MELASFSLCLALMIVARWRIVDAVLRYVSTPNPPDSPLCDIWEQVRYRDQPRKIGGKWLSPGAVVGAFESVVFYGAFVAGGELIGWIIGGYFAFKVACKWEVFAHIYHLPDKLNGISDVDYLIFRARWGANVFDRFLVGTLLNLTYGFAFSRLEDVVLNSIVCTSIRGFAECVPSL